MTQNSCGLLQASSYGLGGHYWFHYDYFSDHTSLDHDSFSSMGNRLSTFMVYLSDVYFGGATAFPLLGKSFQPKKGETWTVVFTWVLCFDQSKVSTFYGLSFYRTWSGRLTQFNQNFTDNLTKRKLPNWRNIIIILKNPKYFSFAFSHFLFCLITSFLTMIKQFW